MADDDMTIAELGRQVRALNTLITEFAEKVMSKEVYLADRRTDAVVNASLKADMERGDAALKALANQILSQRRLMLTTFVGPVLTAAFIAYFITNGVHP